MSAPPSSAVADVLAYNVKVWIAGFAATVFVPLSIVALVLDLVFRQTSSPDSLARGVLRISARFEAFIDIHGDLTDVRVTEDGGASPVERRASRATYDVGTGRALLSSASA